MTEALLAGTDAQAREAARSLREHPDRRAVPPLLHAMRRIFVAESMAEAITAMGTDVVPDLIRALRREESWQVARLLGTLLRAKPAALLEGVRSDNSQVRRYCVELLASTDDPGADAALRTATSDTECGVRSAAMESLRQRGVEFSVDDLLEHATRCGHRGSHIRIWSFWAFREDQRVRDLMLRLSLLPRAGVAAARFLVDIGEIAYVRSMLEGDDPLLVGQAAHVGRFKPVPEFQHLAARRVLDRSLPTAIRLVATKGIGSAISREDASALREISADPHEDLALRRRIGHALGLSGS